MVKIYLEDENKTKEIGYKLGNLLTPGSVICLIRRFRCRKDYNDSKSC